MIGLYLLRMEGGDLAYAIAMLIMAGAAGIAGHFKKKKAQEQFEEETRKRAASGEAPTEPDEPREPATSEEIPDVAELLKSILRRKTGVPGTRHPDPQTPRVEPPLRPARRTRTGPEPAKPARPVVPAARKAPPTLRQAPARPEPTRSREPKQPSLDALHRDKVTIDSTEHSRHIAVGAEQIGRTAEARTRELDQRYIESSLVTMPRKSQARGSRFTRADLRRAIIMNEILGKPVALRDPTAS